MAEQGTTIAHDLHNHLERNQAFYVDLLRQMVAINSFTANGAGVNALGDLTAAAFAGLGLIAEHVPSVHPGHGQHLILTRPGHPDRKIGLVSHLDTVFPPEEEASNSFAWRQAGDRLYGPGTVDCKGGTVLIYMVLDALRAVAPKAYDDVTWVALIDASEEADAEDFQALCLDRLAGETLGCLIFEGGYLLDGAWSVVVARKGLASYRVTVEGKAAHAGGAHREGANAIVQLAGTIGRIAALTDYRRELTFNVGRITGGTVTNRVPHLARAWGEMRTFSPQVFDQGVADLLALAKRPTLCNATGTFCCRIDIEITGQTPPWPRNPATDRLLAVWQAAAKSLGWQAVAEERGGLSDGNALWQAIPTLDGLGPVGANGHCSEQSADGSKEQEYVLASSLVPKAVLDAVAILKLIGR